MTTDTLEKRLHTRAQFFLVRTGESLIPVFSFRPEDAIDAVPALVVDLSDGGVQIMSANNTPLSHSSYLLELVVGDDQPAPAAIAVQLIWARQDGIYTKSGFSFGSGFASDEAIAELLERSVHKILRCVLYPQAK